MYKRKIIFQWLASVVMFLVSSLSSRGQEVNAAAIAAADTSVFSVNQPGGWQLYNSFASTVAADSVELELIVQHVNGIDWNQEQLVGKLKMAQFIPQASQTGLFQLLQSNYSLRVDSLGNCYLRLISGLIPAGDPAIIPVMVRYKK